jgi:hypothetical protein
MDENSEEVVLIVVVTGDTEKSVTAPAAACAVPRSAALMIRLALLKLVTVEIVMFHPVDRLDQPLIAVPT